MAPDASTESGTVLVPPTEEQALQVTTPMIPLEPGCYRLVLRCRPSGPEAEARMRMELLDGSGKPVAGPLVQKVEHVEAGEFRDVDIVFEKPAAPYCVRARLSFVGDFRPDVESVAIRPDSIATLNSLKNRLQRLSQATTGLAPALVPPQARMEP
jgi:hypothetical protein